MKNDFDFIKDKFESDGVAAPDGFGEREVLERIQNVEPLKEKKKSKGMIVGIASAAVASVAVVTAAAILTTSVLGSRPIQVGTPVTVAGSAKLTRFGSREEVRSALDNTIRFNDRLNAANEGNEKIEYYAMEDAVSSLEGSASGSSATGGSASHNSTYLQYSGVDEADTVKTDGKYIYQLSYYNTIDIYEAQGKDSKRIGRITDSISSDGYFIEYYLHSGQLIALENEFVNDAERSYENTVVRVYDLSDIDHISIKQSYAQSGYYCSSRMIDGMLYVVTTEYAADRDAMPVICGEYKNSEATFDEVPAESVYSVENPTESSFLTVSSIDTDSGELKDTKSVLGSAEQIYCNQDNLYVMATEYEPEVYEDIFENGVSRSWAYMPVADRTQLIKISLNEGLEVKASGAVKGRVNNRYSLDEFEGNLRVATTSRAEDFSDINNLYVLDGELNVIGEVTGFAPTESIKAVRYIGSTAYVITYEQTDPLFVIDLSDPTVPVIAGEVKISGFSSLLVPVDDNTLLGIGYHTEDEGVDMEIEEGLKLVTFDVSDKAAPKVLDTKVFKDYSSVVQYDPKALLVNFERNDYTIPYYYCDYRTAWDYDMYFNDAPVKSNSLTGVINFRVEDGKIVIADKYVSEKFGDSNSMVERCVYIGDTIYMLGYSGDSDSPIDCVDYK